MPAVRRPANGAAELRRSTRRRSTPHSNGATTVNDTVQAPLSLHFVGPFRGEDRDPDEEDAESSSEEDFAFLAHMDELGAQMLEARKAARRAEVPFCDENKCARRMRYELRRGEVILLKLTVMEFDLYKCRGERLIHEACDAIDNELQAFAAQLFTSQALFSALHYRRSLQGQGNGAFGTELDLESHVAIMEHINVCTPAGLRKGYGSKALELLTQQPQMRRCNFFFANARGNDGSLAFFRANGYRRVGLTEWFCFAKDVEHPSRQIAAAADHDLGTHLSRKRPPAPATRFELLANGPIGNLAIADQNAARWPLHSAVVNWKRGMPSPILALPIVRRSDLEELDELGYSPLHLAISAGKFELATQILWLPLAAVYAAQKTIYGESCLHLARQAEQENIAYRSAFDLEDDQKSTKAQGAFLENRLKELSPAAIKDCTCGQCHDGWLSPRMRERLWSTSEMHYDIVDMGEEDFNEAGLAKDMLFVDSRHWPEYMKQGRVTKESWRAFEELLESVAGHLRTPGVGLSTIEVVDHARRKPGVNIDAFFHAGGHMQMVWDCLLHASIPQDTDMEASLQRVSTERGVPICANDQDFELVREKLFV